MWRALMFLAGCGLVATGVALVLPWLAFVVGGAMVCGLAALLERSAARAEAEQ